MLRLFVLACSLPLVLPACESPPDPPADPSEAAEPPMEEPVISAHHLEDQPSPAEQRVAAATTDFGLALLRELHARAERPNVFLSPLSVSRALALLANGARGETLEAARETLLLPELSLEELNEGFALLPERLRAADEAVQLELASAVFARRGLPVREGFRERARATFGAEARELDFSSGAAVDAINAWASHATRERIPRVLDSIDDDEVLFLLDAVYFRGAWTDSFDAKRTHAAPFQRADGTTVEVQMMHRPAEETRFLYSEEVLAIELPYGNGAFTAVFLLPPEGVPLEAFLERLEPRQWSQWMAAIEPARVEVSIPRLRLDLKASLDGPLKALGLEIAFDPGRADLLGLVDLPPGQDLFVTRVDHHTHLELDERGTTAAAVTTIGIGIVSAPPTFRADRPFLLAIRERTTGTLLFLGAIGDPTEG